MRDLLRFIFSVPAIRQSHPLIDRGFGLIYDVERNITWLKDLNYARTSGKSRDGIMTWNEAKGWVASLRYRGIGGWRLPTALNPDGSGPCVGHNCKQSEMGHLVFGPLTDDPGHVTFVNFEAAAYYWLSTEASATEAYAFDLQLIKQGTVPKDLDRNSSLPVNAPLSPVLSWPVHDGDVAAMIVQRLFTFGIRSQVAVAGR